MNDEITYIGQVYGHVPVFRSYLLDDDITYPSYVGVELELEGVSHREVVRNIPIDVETFWNFDLDGSLRGPSFEAVLREPLVGVDLTKAITELCRHLHGFNRLEAGPRTSTHVHVDVRDMTPENLQKMILAYMIFEKALFKYVGGGREHSNFCMPTVNFSDLLRGVDGLRAGNWDHFDMCLDGVEKYAALNLQALRKFGSVEFRQHPGCFDADNILTWIDMLLCLKRWAVEYAPGIEDIPAYLSGQGVSVLAEEVFRRHAPKLDYPGMEDACFYGIRRVQDIIHTTQGHDISKKLLTKVRGKDMKGEPLRAQVKQEVML